MTSPYLTHPTRSFAAALADRRAVIKDRALRNIGIAATALRSGHLPMAEQYLGRAVADIAELRKIGVEARR